MRILEAGNLRVRSALMRSDLRHNTGFTLIELLVVVAIVALVSAGVGFALRDSSQVQLERDAERLAALLESARARSRVSGLPVRWHATPDGFLFEGLPPSGQEDSDLPKRWLDAGTHVVEGEGATQVTILLLGPEPIIEPQAVILESRTQPGKTVRVATDGVRPFALQAATP